MPTAEVVTYDPVLFHLGFLPEPIKTELMIISKHLGPLLRRQYASGPKQFAKVSWQIKSLIQGCRFSFDVKPRPDGRPAIVRKTLRLLSRPVAKEPPGRPGAGEARKKGNPP